MSSDHQTDVIYFDFKKAFDSVPHNELLFKLKSMGISGNLWLWFKSYLSNGQQCVKVNNKYSHLLPILSGIPQGSILGPLLFLIQNDIPYSYRMISTLYVAGVKNGICYSIPLRPFKSVSDPIYKHHTQSEHLQ